MEENVDAVHIFLICRNQLIVSMTGPVDINQLAVHEAMRLYEIEDRALCFEKVIALAGHFIEKYKEEHKKQ